eukprot:scaffold43337_cov69-Phaeocystis_antarctica.AAC.3
MECPDVGAAAALRSSGGIAAAQIRVVVGRRWRANRRAHRHERCELRRRAPRLRVAIQPTAAHALSGEYHARRIATVLLEHSFKQPVNLHKVARNPASFGESHSPLARATREDADERKRRGKRAIAEQQTWKGLPVHYVEGAVAAAVQEDQYGTESRGRRERKEELRRQHVGI